MSKYRDTLGRLGDETAVRVQRIVAAHDAGEISRDTAETLIAATVAQANEQAVSLADVVVSLELSIATGAAVPTVGLSRPAGDAVRLRKAAGTLLDVLPGTPDPDARAARLGRSEPLEAAQDARGQALAQSDLVEGWTRSTAGKCQLCSWWARGGRVWPKSHPMPRHKGCRCTQTPVLVERVRPVQH